MNEPNVTAMLISTGVIPSGGSERGVQPEPSESLGRVASRNAFD